MRNNSLRLALIPAVAAIALFTQSARANLVIDGSFETPVLSPGAEISFPGGTTAGTSMVLGNDVLIIQSPGSEVASSGITFNAEDGIQSCDLTGSGNTGLTDGVSQDVPTTPGVTYAVSFFVGTALSNNGSPFYQTPAEDDLSIDGGARVPFINPNTTPGFVNWQPFTYDFTATNSTTNIAFFDGETTNSFAGLDNVRVDAIPEPTSMGFLGVGVLALLRRRR